MNNMLALLLAQGAQSAQAAQSEKVLIWTLILTSGGTFAASVVGLIKYLIDRRSDQKKQERADAQTLALREQDRLDAKLKADIILSEGARREKRLSAKIDENTAKTEEGIAKTVEGIAKSEEALNVSNGHKENLTLALNKVAAVSEVIAEATKAVASAKGEE